MPPVLSDLGLVAPNAPNRSGRDRRTATQISTRTRTTSTLANIGLARALGIPIRGGLISFGEQQRIIPAVQQLERLSIRQPGVDHVGGVGRGASGQPPTVGALCGQCARGRLAVLPTGDVFPCVFSRWAALRVGSVLTQSLADILCGPALTTTRTQLKEEFDQRPRRDCQPRRPDCTPNCAPASGACKPDRPPGDRGQHPGMLVQQRELRLTAGAAPQMSSCYPDADRCPPTICIPDTVCGPNDGCQPDR